MMQVRMGIDGGRDHIEFWCSMFHPYQFYYPKEPYMKGEKLCNNCCIEEGGIIYRAPFDCKHIQTPTYLARFCIERGDLSFFRSHPADIPKKTQQQFKDLFGWLNGDKTETRRNTKTKAPKASKERKDIHGSNDRETSGLVQDNSKREEVEQPEEEIRQSQGEQGNIPDPTISNGGGLQGVSEAALMQQIVRDVFGEGDGAPVQSMWSEGNVQVDRKYRVGDMPIVQGETKMKEEYDDSYDQTTAHSCITCKCGTKVWYGCGVKQLTRPKYCKACEKKERERIIASYKDKVDSHELHRIIEWELRRGINR